MRAGFSTKSLKFSNKDLMVISDKIEKLLLKGFTEETDHLGYIYQIKKMQTLVFDLNLKEVNKFTF